MTQPLAAIRQINPRPPTTAARAFVEDAWFDFLFARSYALQTDKDDDWVSVFAAFTRYQRTLADWHDGVAP